MQRFVSLGLAGAVWLSGAAVAAPSAMQEKRSGLTAAAGDDGKIYVVGGDRSATRPTFESYDPSTNQWTRLSPPPVKRFGAGAAFVDGAFFVLGGENGYRGSQDYDAGVLRYEPRTDTWREAGDIRLSRTDVGVTVSGGRIYTVGGTGVIHGGSPAPAIIPDPQDDNYIDAFGVRFSEAFDPTLGQHHVLPAVPRRRAMHALVTAPDSRVLAVGGFFWADWYPYPDFATSIGARYVNATVEAFDPATSRWTLVSRMPTPRYALAAVVKGGKLYTFGGLDGRHATTAAVEVMDIATGTWETKVRMPTPRARHAATLGADGRIYVLGGESDRLGVTNAVEVYDPARDTWETSVVRQPTDDFDFAVLERLFAGVGSQLPVSSDAVGWRVGRCFTHDAPTAMLGALLVGYASGNGVKVATLQTDGSDPDWFDELTADKRETIREALEGHDPGLRAARAVDGNYLGSLYVSDSGATFEYQVKQTPQYWLSRVVAVSGSSSVPAGQTKTICYHARTLTN